MNLPEHFRVLQRKTVVKVSTSQQRKPRSDCLLLCGLEPVLATFLLPQHVKAAQTIVVRLLHRVYEPALRFALANRAIVVGIEIAVIALTVSLIMPRLGSEFLPQLEEGN
jgi:Cu/Ag efflux pump CusA